MSMKIERTVEYAVRALAFMATRDRSTITQIEEATGDPKNYLIRILNRLNAAGLVTSSKGYHGGFSLALPANRITVWDVFRVLEGEFRLESECLYRSAKCGSEGDPQCCKTLIRATADALHTQLSKVTIADIALLAP